MRNGARVRLGGERTAMSVASVQDHRCDHCGYQIATEPPFPRCPMCGAEDWRPVGLVSGRRRAAAV
jgi:rubrerythrin